MSNYSINQTETKKSNYLHTQTERNKEIYRLYQTGSYTYRKLGRIYKISHQRVSDLIKAEEAKQ